MNIGVICPSEIAIRRFMPALNKCKEIKFMGVGVYTKSECYCDAEIKDEEFQNLLEKEKAKAQQFIDRFGGKIFGSYMEIVTSPEIDAVYIPLPPALHYKWAKIALQHGKHVLLEKPATISSDKTEELISIAQNNNLALHENYMFVFHNQIKAIDEIVSKGELGDIRLFRINFGFPMRASNDFRYRKELGGGALIDAGGYTIRYATHLLGDTAQLCYAQSNYIENYNVDIYGSAALVNDKGLTAQIAFGMDNDYKCELEIWGSKGSLITSRVLTAPVGFVPTATICKNNEVKVIELPEDDTFQKSIQCFISCIENKKIRAESYRVISRQSVLLEDFKRMARWD